MPLSRRLSACCLFLALTSCPGLAAATDAVNVTTKPTSFEQAVRGTTSLPGFVHVYADAAQGRVLLGIGAFDQPFLLVTSLPWGLGSNDIGLDRGQPGNVHEVEFRRFGKRVMLVERNTRYVARADSRGV